MRSTSSSSNNSINQNKQIIKQNSKQKEIIDDELINECEDDDSNQRNLNTSSISMNNNNNNNNNSSNNGTLGDDDNGVLQVNCNSIVATLHKKKFGSGGKGKCINLDNKWLTPIEFEQYCGKGNCRDWKRTIKCGGQQLLTLLDNNVLLCHAVSCSCSVCSNDSNVVGPIRPFLRYRRRKRDEILAQNAYKKFLSLKPPTLMTNNDFDRLHSQTNFLLNNINATCNLVGGGMNNNNGNNGHKNDYSSIEDALSTISSTNSDYMDNANANNNNENSYQNNFDQNNTNNNSLNLSINNQNNNISQLNDYSEKNENNYSYNGKFSNSVKEMQKLESEQWNLLEKVCKKYIYIFII